MGPGIVADEVILEAVAGQEAWIKDLLVRLVGVPTTVGNEEVGQQEVEASLREVGLEPVDVPMDAAALRAHPQAAPFDWEVAGKRNVVATWGGGDGRSLILNGHIDVVTPEPLARWGGRSPFEARTEDDWLYGRGAADMKAGLAAILGAVKGLRAAGLAPQGVVHLESVVEEECTGNGTLQTILAGYTADAVVIGEPFGAAITTAQVGVLWFAVRIDGEPGHAAETAVANVIETSLSVIGALRALESEMNAAPLPPFDQVEHPINLNVGEISGGEWPSTAPAECVTRYRIALYPGERIGDLRTRIESAVATVDASAQVLYSGFASEGYVIADDHPLVETLAASFARQAGEPPARFRTTGATDAGIFGNVAGIPAVCFGPFSEHSHGIGERVYLPSVIQTAQVLGLFIKDWCGLA
jgi:acetylornithine deacetylase